MKILIADDHIPYCETVKECLSAKGWRVLLANTIEDATAVINAHHDTLNLVLLDIEFNGEQQSGMDVLAYSRKHYPLLPVVMITGKGSLDTAVRATKLGAENFYEKSLMTTDRLIELVAAYANNKLSRNEQQLIKFLSSHGIITQSPRMLAVAEDILRYARTNLNILISGETGTGKGLVAKAIHTTSTRNKGPFVHVDIPNIARELFQSEMFGHVRGAFTGALQDRRGYFATAHRGTLFLDEIGELLPDLQACLLIPVEQKRFCRVGSTEYEEVDIRFVTATDRDLARMVENGSFREQLFYRLRDVEVMLPPLRERPEDIPLIAQSELCRLCRENHQPEKAFTPGALELLRSLKWQGNVRELISTVRRCYAIAVDCEFIKEADVVSVTQCPPSSRSTGPSPLATLRDAAAQAEKEAIVTQLKIHKGNVTKAAAALKISRESLYQKMSIYGIAPKQYRDH
ncbi:MAG: sigma-54 dependent transcriptional regulator [Chlorobi bacterium]|nr:sigma-54 dependent transcriptional regulator [Chlorobiota bacterium]